MNRAKLLAIQFFLFVGVIFTQQDQNQNMLRLAQAFEQQGDFERSLQIYKELFAKDSTNYVFFDALRRVNVQLKRYEEAINLSSRRFRLTPFDFNLQANIGSLYYMNGKEQKADSVWNVVLRSANKNQMYYRSVANEQANQRLFDKAIATYLLGRKEIGDQFIFANELGYLYSFMMDFTNSVREYLLLLRQNEQQFEFVQSRIASLVARPDGLNSAIKVIEEEIKLRKSISYMRLQLWLYMEANRFHDALIIAQLIEQAINSNGQELFTFAERVFRENEFSVSATAYQLALKSGTKMPFTQTAKYGYARSVEELSLQGKTIVFDKEQNVSLLETQPNFSGAINLYTAIVKEYPITVVGANALYRIGWIKYKQLFDLDGALQMFDSVLVTSPVGPMVPITLSAIGDIYIAQNKLDAAAKKFSSLSVSPFANQEQRTLAHYRLAEVQFFKNNFDSTLSLLKPLTENLKADESNDALLLQYFISGNTFQFAEALKQFARAELLARQFKLSESINEFSSIVDIYPTAPLADDALLKKAEYSIQLKRFAEALTSYNKLLEDYKESLDRDKTQFKIGELYQFHLLDKQKAIAAYQVVLEKYPFSLFVEEARKRIRILRGDAS